MYAYVFFIITCMLLAACSPNKQANEQAKDPTSISAEQQKRDAAALLEAENALLKKAEYELEQVENTLAHDSELNAQQREQLLLEIAEREKLEAEQHLIQSAKMEADKAKALLEQAASNKEDLPDSIP